MNNIDKIVIRELKTKEIAILTDMLYESIFQTDEANPISRDVIKLPELSQYIANFGQRKNDYCLIAEFNNKIIGAVWTRILDGKIKGYGYIDDKTPEFAISLYKDFRKQGIGTLLMKRMISHLIEKGYKQASLSVKKENYAFKMYQKLRFEIIKENNEDYLMLLKLSGI